MTSPCRVELEPFDQGDFARLINWIGSREELVQWGGPVFEFPLDRTQLARHISAQNEGPPDKVVYRVVDALTLEVVGHAEIGAIDRVNGCARASRLLVGKPECRGQGYGIALVEALLSVAFDELKLHRVELGVYDFNDTAIRCYERAGFVHEGVRREAVMVEGKYWNSCIMSILEHEWRSRQPQG